MTTIYALIGRVAHSTATTRSYYTTRAAAEAALVEEVLAGKLTQPIAVEVIEPHGPDLDGAELVEHLRDAGAASLPDLLDMYRTEGQVEAERAARIDPEHERRRQAVIDAAENLRGYHPGSVASRAVVELQVAVEALREYAPAGIVAPAPEPEQAPAATASVRDELHALAPLPWSVANEQHEGEVCTADGRLLFTVYGPGSYKDDMRIAELLVQLVNGPEVPLRSPWGEDLRRTEQAVLDAAREYRARWIAAETVSEQLDALFAAIDSLVELDKGSAS